MKRHFIILLLILLVNDAFAQVKKDKALLKTAKYEHNQLRFAYAIPVFKSYLQKQPKDTAALKLLAESYFKLNKFDSALVYQEKAIQFGAIQSGFLAELYANNGKYQQAQKLYEQFLEEQITKLSEARLYGFKNYTSLVADSLDYTLFNTKLNTGYNEYNSVLYKEGLVFESNRLKEQIRPKKWIKRVFTKRIRPSEFAWDGAGYTKLYYFANSDSVRLDAPAITANNWREKPSKSNYTDFTVVTPNDSKKIPGSFNLTIPAFQDNGVTSFDAFLSDKLNVGAVSFTKDGEKAYYTRNQKKSTGTYQLEIWEAFQIAGRWVGEHRLFFNNPKFSYFHPAITPDGKRLYYVSDDNAGNGGTDIYFVDQNEDGSWKNTVNLGQDINTSANELFPTFYEGNLYISSNGHPGLGGLDIYKLAINKNGVPEVKNMGYPINSNKDDFAFSIKGEKGFFSTNRNGTDDIIAFDHIVSLIKMKGKVLVDSNCIAGKKVYLYQKDANGISILKDSATIDNNCNYTFNVRPNQFYSITTSDNQGKLYESSIFTDDYAKIEGTYWKDASLINIPLAEKENLIAQQVKEAEMAIMSKTFRLTIDSLKAIAKDYVELHHPFDQVYIIEKDLASYYKIIEMVKKLRNKKIVIVSAADCNGSLDYNEDLSARRANRIFRTLSKLSDNEVVIKNVGERELLKACDDVKKSIEEQVVNRYSYVFIIDKN
ncbi:MAG: hypothetical protein RL387_285 [Bacteroidota bacterium]